MCNALFVFSFNNTNNNNKKSSKRAALFFHDDDETNDDDLLKVFRRLLFGLREKKREREREAQSASAKGVKKKVPLFASKKKTVQKKHTTFDELLNPKYIFLRP